MPQVGDLAYQQQRILDLISQAGNIYNTDPLAQQQAGFFQAQPFQNLLGQVQGRASGQDAPFTQPVINSLLAQQSDAVGAGFGGARDALLRQLTRRGLGGSGLGISAQANMRRQATAQQIAGRRDITSRAQLNNFQARQQAQQQLQGLLGQQFSGQQQFLQGNVANQNLAAQREIDFRSRMQEIGPGMTPRQQANRDRNLRWYTAQANMSLPGNDGSFSGQQMFGVAQQRRNTARDTLNQMLAGFA
jgi:hypothetical protein